MAKFELSEDEKKQIELQRQRNEKEKEVGEKIAKILEEENMRMIVLPDSPLNNLQIAIVSN